MYAKVAQKVGLPHHLAGPLNHRYIPLIDKTITIVYIRAPTGAPIDGKMVCT